MELLCDSRHGQFIPQIMGERLLNAGWKGIEQKDVDCLADTENEWYWEAWESILNNAQFIDENGETWYLHHDGDLWAVTQKDFDDMGDF